MLRKMFSKKVLVAKKVLCIVLSVLLIQTQLEWSWAQGVPSASGLPTTPPVLTGTAAEDALDAVNEEILDTQSLLDTALFEIEMSNKLIEDNTKIIESEKIFTAGTIGMAYACIADAEKIESDIAAIDAKIAQNNATINANNAKIAENSSIYWFNTQIMNACDQNIANNNAKIAQNNAEIASNNSRIAANDAQIAANNGTIQWCDAQMASLAHGINANNAEIAANNNRINQINAAIAAKSSFANGCDNSINSCNAQIDANNAQIAKLKKRIKKNEWYEAADTLWCNIQIAALKLANGCLEVAKAATVAAKATWVAVLGLFNSELWALNGRNFALNCDNIGKNIAYGACAATRSVVLGVLSFFNSENASLRWRNMQLDADSFWKRADNAVNYIYKGAADLARNAVVFIISLGNAENWRLTGENLGLSLKKGGKQIALLGARAAAIAAWALASVAAGRTLSLLEQNKALVAKKEKLAKTVETLTAKLESAKERKAKLETDNPVSMSIAAQKMGLQQVLLSVLGFSSEGMDANKGFAVTKYVYKDGKRTAGVTYKTDALGKDILLTVYSFNDKGKMDRITDLTTGKYIQYGTVACSDGTEKWLATKEFDALGKMIGEYHYDGDGKLTSKDVFGVTVDEYEASSGQPAPESKITIDDNGNKMLLTEKVFYDSHQKPSRKSSYFLFVPKTEKEKIDKPGDAKMWKNVSQIESLVGAGNIKKDATGGIITEEYLYAWDDSQRDYVLNESTSYSLESFDMATVDSTTDSCGTVDVKTGVETKWKMNSETTKYDKGGNAQFVFNENGDQIGEYNYSNGLLTSLTRWDKSEYDMPWREETPAGGICAGTDVGVGDSVKMKKDIKTVITFDNMGRVNSVNVSGTMDTLIDINKDSKVVDEARAAQIGTITIDESYVYKYNDTNETVPMDVYDMIEEGLDSEGNPNYVSTKTDTIMVKPGGLMNVERTSHSYGEFKFTAEVGCLDKEITQTINEKSKTIDYYDDGKLVSVSSQQLTLTEDDLAKTLKAGIGKPGTKIENGPRQAWQGVLEGLSIGLEWIAWITYAIATVAIIVVAALGSVVTAGASIVAALGWVTLGATIGAMIGSIGSSVYGNTKIDTPKIEPPSDFNPANPGYSAVSLMPPVDPPAEGPEMMAPIMSSF